MLKALGVIAGPAAGAFKPLPGPVAGGAASVDPGAGWRALARGVHGREKHACRPAIGVVSNGLARPLIPRLPPQGAVLSARWESRPAREWRAGPQGGRSR